jgi:hypothetical protein
MTYFLFDVFVFLAYYEYGTETVVKEVRLVSVHMMVNVMSKQDALSGRVSLRVFPEICDLIDMESIRLRRAGVTFGGRKAKQAVVIMAAVEEFLSIPEEIRNKLYEKRVEQYEKRLAEPAPKLFALPNPPSAVGTSN